MRTDLVEEVTVMADDDDRVVKVQQEVFQPAHGLNVQIVGRLVQQQDIRAAKERLSKQDLDLLAAVEFLHQGMLPIQADTKTGQDHLRIAFSVPAVQFGKLTLQNAGALTVLVGKVFLAVELVLLLHDLIQALMTHDNRRQDFIFIKLKVVLLQNGHTFAGRDHDVARGRLQFAGEHLEESRLAGTVGANNAVAVACGKLDVDILKERLSAVRERNILGCDHGFLVLLFEVVIFL